MPWMALAPGHQRRVQRRGDLRDHLDADEHAEHEDRQPDDTGVEVTVGLLVEGLVGRRGRSTARASVGRGRGRALDQLAGRLVDDPSALGDAAARQDLVGVVGCEHAVAVVVLRGHQRDQVDDVLGVELRRPGRASGSARCEPPQTWALPIRTTSPATEPSTLPPLSAARSTTTEPGFICSTISRVTSIGACRPGTAAVVIRASAAAMYGREQLALPGGAVLGHLAGVAAGTLEGLELELDGASRPSIGSPRRRPRGRRTPGRRRRAAWHVAIACRPATPAPSTTTSAGWTVPAAVMFSGKNRRSKPAATMAQR